MTSPEPARTPLSERLSPVAGPSGINLRPRDGKNNVSEEGCGGGKSKGGVGGRGGRIKRQRGQSGRQGQQPPSRGAKRGGGKKVTFGNPPQNDHKDKSTMRTAAVGGGGAGRHVHSNKKGPNPNAQSEAAKGKKDESMTTQNRSRPRPPLRNRRASSFTEGHGKSGGGVVTNNTRHRWKHYGGGRRSSSSNMNKTVLPSKFLLGGNIRDPLNLNSLADERISKIVNAITPESSPLPTPKHRKAEYKIEVLIPPNITDPLNLNSGVDENEYAAKLASNNPVVRRKKFRYRKRVRSSSHKNAAAAAAAAAARAAVAQAGSQSEPELGVPEKSNNVPDAIAAEVDAEQADSVFVSPPPAAKVTLPLKRPSTLRGPSPAKKVLKQPEAEIVSPVVPQPGQKKPVRKQHYHHKHRQERRRQQQQQGRNQQGRGQQGRGQSSGAEAKEGCSRQDLKPSRTKMNAERNRRFEFGNYSRYYGYRRDPLQEEDPRLKYLKPDWFRGKEVLDVGCNQGDVTCALAQPFFGPKSIVGIDIDKSLIEAARRNVASFPGDGSKQSDYPQSLPAMYGPIDPTGLGNSSSNKGKGRGKGKGK